MISWTFSSWYASLGAQLVKNQPAIWETSVRSLGWEGSLEKGTDYPLQYSSLENSMDCVVHGVAKSRTRLSEFHSLSSWYREGDTLTQGNFLSKYKFPLCKGNFYSAFWASPVFAVSQNNQLKIILTLKRHILGWHIRPSFSNKFPFDLCSPYFSHAGPSNIPAFLQPPSVHSSFSWSRRLFPGMWSPLCDTHPHNSPMTPTLSTLFNIFRHTE